MLTDLLTVVVLGFVGFRLVSVVGRIREPAVRERVVFLWKGIRPRHVLPVPLVLAVVLAVATALIQVPGLSWGWWTAIGGIGNPVMGGSDRTAGTALAWLVPLVFVLLLLPGLPLFAEAEERAFRVGTENQSWPTRLRRQLTFGLVHALIGIPVGVALALSVGGCWFLFNYLRGGVLESTRAHTAYNAVIILIVLVALVFTGGLS